MDSIKVAVHKNFISFQHIVYIAKMVEYEAAHCLAVNSVNKLIDQLGVLNQNYTLKVLCLLLKLSRLFCTYGFSHRLRGMHNQMYHLIGIVCSQYLLSSFLSSSLLVPKIFSESLENLTNSIRQ